MIDTTFCYYCGFCSIVTDIEKGVIPIGRMSQRKGRAGERELAALLRKHGYDVQAAEPLNYGTIPDLTGLPGVHIECKRTEQLRLSEWMAQAQRDSEKFKDGRPAVFFRRSRSPWMVCMELGDWMELYRRSTKV